MTNFKESIREDLFAMQDQAYRDFHARLMPTVSYERIIGIRVPRLRAYAKKIANTESATLFLYDLPHFYYEENNLHAFLIERIGSYEDTVAALDRFLPYIDNWATCDGMRPKVFARHLTDLYPTVRKWIASERPYTVRYGVGMLCSYYLGDAFSPEHLALAASIESEEYYVKMMVAWYFATALARQYDAALPYVTQKCLDPMTHRMTVRKAIESRKIGEETKKMLREERF